VDVIRGMELEAMTEMLKPATSPQLSASPPAARSSGSPVCHLRIRGMDCPSCADDISRALFRLAGVEHVQVDVVAGSAKIAYVPDMVTRDELHSVVQGLGYEVSGVDSRRHTFVIEGMCCASEVRQLEAKLAPMPGVGKLEFDILGRRLTVYGPVAAHDVQRAVREIGMAARAESQAVVPATLWERRGRTIMSAASGVLLAAGLIAGWRGGSPALEVALLACAAVSGGWFVVPRAWRAALGGVLDMNVLMTLATVGAAVIGEWSESASVMFLFAVAQILETYSMDRARHAIRGLMELSPAEATVRRDGREATVPVGEVDIGAVVIVRPGQKIPLDGVVEVGESSVNQAAITGESIPVDKSPGAEVFAGSLNENGVLEIRVTTFVEDTTLAQIIHAVEEAQASRAPAQGFVDRFSAIYTPSVVVIAVLLAVVPPLIGLGSWSTWLYRALAMLVVACPCALVISTPVSIVSGLAGAAKAGILIKGGLHLESLGTATVVALDKTGTLTDGRPRLVHVTALSASADEVLRLAAALEHGSEHPLSRAILAAAANQQVVLPSVDAFRALAGRGVSGIVERQTLYAGNRRLMDELGIVSPDMIRTVEAVDQSGQTAVVLATADRPLGVLAIGDRARPEAMGALQAVRRLGVRHIVMLTGDGEGAARAVAATLGIDDVRAGLLPNGKVEAIRDMVARGERVVFVGDGVNDAPALAAATVGIAMGVAGTDVALETADVALMADDLSKLPVALQASRQTLRIIKQNVVFSLVIKAVFLVLAIGGWATLWMAVTADMGSSLLVIANGLRARRVN
jgi:Cd2+/Zn2+-exporting ATPase